MPQAQLLRVLRPICCGHCCAPFPRARTCVRRPSGTGEVLRPTVAHHTDPQWLRELLRLYKPATHRRAGGAGVAVYRRKNPVLVEEQRKKPDSWSWVDGQWVQVTPKSKAQRLAEAQERIRQLEAALGSHHE